MSTGCGERKTDRITRIFDAVERNDKDRQCPVCGKPFYNRVLNHYKKQYEYKHRFPTGRSAFTPSIAEKSNRSLTTVYCYQPLRATA